MLLSLFQPGMDREKSNKYVDIYTPFSNQVFTEDIDANNFDTEKTSLRK